jgi:adenine-specific DNA-methyltransferase
MINRNKLELTWIGKGIRPKLEPRVFLEKPDSSYHAARRITENDLFDNMLIRGDNLLALKALEQRFTGTFKCVYIDPPFNTGEAFEHYEDGLEHSIWLQLMRDRIELLHSLLSIDGSLFIHIDDNELAYLIALVDEVFDRRNRISVISFKQSAASGPKSVNPGLVTTSNFILYYAKDRKQWKPNRVYVPIGRDARYNNYIVNVEAPHRDWKLTTLRSAFAAEAGVEVRDLDRSLGSKLEDKLTTFVLTNRFRVVQPALVRSEDINVDARTALEESTSKPDRVTKSPREERYFLNGKQLLFYASKTQVIDGKLTTAGLATTIWDDLFSNNIHKEGGVSFPNGKKPEGLIKRILELSTARGDLVLDSFAGSGTTGAVAHKMGRKWVMVELGEACDTHILPRMKSVIDGSDSSGITQAVSWKGGGGFRYYRLAPSLLEKDKFGNWVISRQYNAAMLAEAMCKFEGFTYAPSDTQYWMQGYSTERDFIYVTTQTLTRDQLLKLSDEVGENHSLLVCCSAFRIKDVSQLPNLTIKKIPKLVLNRCEWGRDDYSLEIKNLRETIATPEPASVAFANGRKKSANGSMNLFEAAAEESDTNL